MSWIAKLCCVILTQNCERICIILKVLFGKRLRQLREEKGVTQEQLAEAVGYTPRHINRIEHGKSGPHFDQIDKMAEFLDVSLADLFDFSQLPKEP